MRGLNDNMARRRVHRMALGLACATFPLIWVGGLVTSYQAGMAVPDWPTTFGYNPFLYPLRTWFFGPWDIFVEHGHRLFGAVVGLLTIALVIVAQISEPRRWVRCLAWLALPLVIAQGVLGGMRVRLDERLLAQIHGCVGPAFFALTAALAVCTSRGWTSATEAVSHGRAQKMQGLALLTTVLSYLQLLVGAQIRHIAPGASPSLFRGAVLFHLLLAVTLLGHAGAVFMRAGGVHRELVPPARALALLMAVQVALGVWTWVVKFGWPHWLRSFSWAQNFVVTRGGLTQPMVTTAHVATGSLILVTSLLVTLRSFRYLTSGHADAVPRIGREAVA